jgi:hypothetical protein
MSCLAYLSLDMKYLHVRINIYGKELKWEKKNWWHDSDVDFL